jgi:hypothetical protein
MSTGDEERIEEYGRYKIVARHHAGAFRGVLWHLGKKLAEVTGTSVDDVRNALMEKLGLVLEDRARLREVDNPTAAETAKAFALFEKHLSRGQLAMLRAHYHAPAREITATQLADAAGYESYSAANLQYGRIGWMLFGEIPTNIPSRDGKRIYTFTLASGKEDRDNDQDWVWKMRPHVADALKLLGIVS